jgi:hypothetical protein
VNIFLIPYTWWRHLQFGFWSAMLSLFCWWGYLTFMIVFGALWSSSWDSFITGFLLVFSCAGSNILGEANLRRWSAKELIKKFIILFGASIGLSMLLFWMWHFLSGLFFHEANMVQHMVALKYRLGDFICAGLSAAVSVIVVRKWAGWSIALNHLSAGLLAGLGAAALWSVSAYYLVQNLYWAGAVAFAAFGFLFGVAAWGIPDDLYVGWVRVLKGSRFSQRIPIDAVDQRNKERFLGHYPNGLDLYLPENEGVLELHASIVHSPSTNQYILRGLSLEHTRMKRMFEWAKVDYDPTSPAPREVELQNGDRIELGEQAEVEFLILPREER